MDQVRIILKLLWRERFWVLSVVGVLLAVICWHFSSGDLDQQFFSRKQAIEGKFSAMRNLTQENPLPNENVIEGDREQARQQSKNVLAVWKQLYDRQRNEVLYWPKDSLKPSFIAVIEKLKFRDPFPAQQAKDMRSHYWNYIGGRFDGLLKIVKALKSEEGVGSYSGGGRRGGRRMEGEGMDYEGSRSALTLTDAEQEDEDYLVQWLDQGNLRGKLQFASEPSVLQIWVTQEDLWVYETLLNVIAKTNEFRGATRPDNTAVRVIVALEVGQDAAVASREKSSILMPQSMIAEGGEGMLERGMSESEGGREMYAEGGLEGEGVSDAEVLAFRYLDPEGNPYPGEPEDKEFRRLPIRMKLFLDQRYLSQLLVECANAALPVEVKQVRVNPEVSGAGFGGERYGASSRSYRGMSGTEEIESDANLADVEIRGVVYIYNQPDESVFELLGGDEDQLADASAGG